MVSVLIVSVGH